LEAIENTPGCFSLPEVQECLHCEDKCPKTLEEVPEPCKTGEIFEACAEGECEEEEYGPDPCLQAVEDTPGCFSLPEVQECFKDEDKCPKTPEEVPEPCNTPEIHEACGEREEHEHEHHEEYHEHEYHEEYHEHEYHEHDYHEEHHEPEYPEYNQSYPEYNLSYPEYNKSLSLLKQNQTAWSLFSKMGKKHHRKPLNPLDHTPGSPKRARSDAAKKWFSKMGTKHHRKPVHPEDLALKQHHAARKLLSKMCKKHHRKPVHSPDLNLKQHRNAWKWFSQKGKFMSSAGK